MNKPLGTFFVAAAIASAGMGHAMGLGLPEPYLELSHERFYEIKAEIARTTDAAIVLGDSIVVLGDSIVQGAPLPEWICGHPVVNAGVTGAAVQYFERHASELLGLSRPRLIVLAVGINNASPKMARQFRSHYRTTVVFLSRVAPVAVATITPVRSGNGSAGYDRNLVPRLNDAIKTTPNVKAVIDLNSPLSGANWTTDGIHFGERGYALWSTALVNGMIRALGCQSSRALFK
jgi:hypothetical protein